jgi:hypothetical protein
MSFAIREIEDPRDWLTVDTLGRLICGELVGCAGEKHERAIFLNRKVAFRVAKQINSQESTDYVVVVRCND